MTAPRPTLAALVAITAATGLMAAVTSSPAQEDQALVGSQGQFAVDCNTPQAFSHRAPVDAIVFPGQPGASHMHDFLGNASTDENTTNESLRASPVTNCLRGPEEHSGEVEPRDLSAYWVPTLYKRDVAIAFTDAKVEYRLGRRARDVQPFPDDLRVIAGTAAGDPSGDGTVYRWVCLDGYRNGDRGTATRAPRCLTNRLHLLVHFPECWDGHSVDSQDHKSHMAYAAEDDAGVQACPDTHLVPVPRLTLEVTYPTNGGAGVRLASGDLSSSHADFMNAWDTAHQAFLVEECVNADRYCGTG